MGNRTETVNPPEKAKPEPKVRVNFITLVDKSMLNPEGKIVGIPEGYNSKEHLAPKRAEFANEADYMDFQANIFESVIASKQARIAKLRANAEELRKYGDPTVRKEVARGRKLAEQLIAIKKSLGSSDVDFDVDALLAGAE